MKAAEDSLLLLLNAHAVTAAKTLLALNPRTSNSFSYMAKSIINNYLLLPSSSSCEDVGESANADGVHLYARELLTLSLLWHSYHDASREGDGERILLC